jgi:hypothetical protein
MQEEVPTLIGFPNSTQSPLHKGRRNKGEGDYSILNIQY